MTSKPDDGYYVVEQIELSSESDPEELPDIEEFEEEVHVNADISNLDSLLKTVQ